MAEKTFASIEQEFNSAKKNFNRLNVQPNSDGSYTVDGQKFDARTFGIVLREARTRLDAAENALDTARSRGGKSESTSNLAGLQKSLTTLENNNKKLASDLAAGKKGPTGKPISQKTIDANNKKIEELRKQISDLSAPATTTSRGPLQGEVQGPFVGGAGETGLKATASQDSPVTTTTSTGGGGGTTTGGGTTKTSRAKLPKNWEARFREMFPAQSWLLDLDRTKYPALYKLIQRGVTDKMWETPESQARFAAELQNTDFFTELKTKDTVRQVKAVVGDLGFDSVPFNKFLVTASNFGWEGDVLKSEVYKEAFRRDDDGNFVNPTAVTRAKASTDYKKAQGFGRAFFSTISDSTIEQRLTGVITDEDLIRQQRELAKTKYAHLGNLIDQGLTLEDIAGSFQQQAARVLERDINAIDMGSADFETAFNFGEPGQKRLMSSGEWEIMLRSDAKYGWDKTENAKQEARTLASSIAQAFGKVM